jgi:hypothetical protein
VPVIFYVYIKKTRYACNLASNNDSLSLKIESKTLKLTQHEGYYFYYEKIYNPDPLQIKTYKVFNDFFEENNTDYISFNSNEAETIASLVIPSLKGISNNILIAETLKISFTRIPLRTKILSLKCYLYTEKYIIPKVLKISIFILHLLLNLR